jgi:hypothetical protein
MPRSGDVAAGDIPAIVHGEVERHLAPRGFACAGDLRWVREASFITPRPPNQARSGARKRGSIT